jgi:hypothetical protein
LRRRDPDGYCFFVSNAGSGIFFSAQDTMPNIILSIVTPQKMLHFCLLSLETLSAGKKSHYFLYISKSSFLFFT